MILREMRRFFRRNSVVTIVATVVLAAGFTGTSLALALLAILSRPQTHGLLPLQYMTIAEETSGGGSQTLPWDTYAHWKGTETRPDVLTVAYAEPAAPVQLASRNAVMPLSIAAVSAGFFTSFCPIAIGRDFANSWDNEASQPEIIISWHLAAKLFSAPSLAIGQTMMLDSQEFRIVGVASAQLRGLWNIPTDAWVTPNKVLDLYFHDGLISGTHDKHETSALFNTSLVWKKMPIFYILVGLPKGSRDALAANIYQTIHLDSNQQYDLHATAGLCKDPLEDERQGSWLRLIFILSLCITFAGSVNYCGLLVAQVPQNVAEVRLKRVLGASATRIALESMIGPLLSVVSAFLVAFVVSVCVVVSTIRHKALSLADGSVTWHMLGMALTLQLVLAALLAGAVGLLPVSRLLRDSGAPKLGYTSTTTKRDRVALYTIVISQLAACIILALVAVSILNATAALSLVNTGYDTTHLAALEVGQASLAVPLEMSTTSSGNFPYEEFVYQTLGEMTQLPKTLHASASSCAPFGIPLKMIRLEVLDRSHSPQIAVHFCTVTRSFFATLGNPIYLGEGFSTDALTGDVNEVIINRTLAQDLWPDVNPLHKSIRLTEPLSGLTFVANIVGISTNMRLSGVGAGSEPELFIPMRGDLFTQSFPLYFMIKGSELKSVKSLAPLVDSYARSTMPALGVVRAYQVSDALRNELAPQGYRTYLAVFAACITTAIALLGLYGVLVQLVNSRRKELALRMCFGASQQHIRNCVVLQAFIVVSTAGFVASTVWLIIRKMASITALYASSVPVGQLHGDSFIISVVTTYIIIACLVSLRPASSAADVSPATLLREL